jgi:hypothetical protein
VEEFIAHNWSRISWGAALELYRNGDQTGRQFPAETWSIDFLALDAKRNVTAEVAGSLFLGGITPSMLWALRIA